MLNDANEFWFMKIIKIPSILIVQNLNSWFLYLSKTDQVLGVQIWYFANFQKKMLLYIE